MIRNLKVLGLALVAVFAMSAVAASAASAQQGVLTSDGPVTLTGTETGTEQNYFESFGVKIECEDATYSGHKFDTTPHQFIPNEETSVTVTPTYDNCFNANNGKAVTITVNECDFEFTDFTTAEEKEGTYGFTVDLVCEGAPIVLTGPGLPCTVEVLPKNDITGFHATSTAEDIDITGKSSNITARACSDLLTTNAAVQNIDVTVKGHNELGEPTGVSISD